MVKLSAKNSEKKNIWVVITTFNGAPWIKQCIESLKRSTVTLSIVIVDNNSADKTCQIIKNESSKIILLQQSKNMGFGAGNNIGISYALNHNADYIFILNQDAYVEKDTIDKLYRISIINPDFGIISPIHLNGNGDKLDNHFMQYLSANKFLFYDALKSNYRSRLYDLPFVNAAAWLVPRRVFLEVGGFDPIFFHYGEDTNFCQRISFHNYKIGVFPHAFILHDREFRNDRISFLYSDEYFEDHRRNLKVKYANINIDFPQNTLSIEKKILLKSAITKLFKLNIRISLIYLKKYRYLDALFEFINRSRVTTRSKGCHYLTLN